MRKQLLRPISWLLAVLLLAGVLLIPGAPKASAAPASQSTVENIQDGVTLHCWNWSYKDIEKNLDKIVALGYTSIQTSPIQQAKQATAEHPFGDWWAFYQPMGFHIDNTGDSALGTKAEFESLCNAAHKKGIKVIVDIVANHVGNSDTGTGISDSVIAELRNDSNCWHDINKNINNYSSRLEVTQYCMDGLPDLNTADKKVQNLVLDLLKECIDAGADGFRFDAAKHIETPDDAANIASDFWPTVINGAVEYAQTSRGIDLYCYGELLDSPGNGLSVDAYTKYMNITDNAWGNVVRNSVIGGKNANAFSHSYKKSADADQLVIWAESHDTYAGGDSKSMSETDINRTWALVAARADAMALYLARPANMSQYLGTGSNTGWAFPEVSAVNHFHNAFVGQSEYVSSENGIAYVERGTSGVVLVNCKGGSVKVNVTAHAMADGTYTDRISGNTFTVSGGKISGTIGSETGIAVVYKTESCAHKSHDLDGFCKDCSALIGHSYDNSGTCSCGDKEIGTRTVYFHNTANWKNINFYSWYTPTDIISEAWPGSAMTHVEGNIYSCTIPVDAPFIIFNNGSTQTNDLRMPAPEEGTNLFDYKLGVWVEYENEPTIPTEPSTEPSEEITEPSEEITEPSEEITEPSEEITEPSEEVTEPSEEITEPSEEITEPSEEITEPSVTEPSVAPTEPSEEVTEPSKEGTEPSEEVTEPSQTTPSEPSEGDKEESNNSLIWVIAGAAVTIAIAAVLFTVLKKKRG